MELLLLIAVIVLGVALYDTRVRLIRAERRVDALEKTPVSFAEPEAPAPVQAPREEPAVVRRRPPVMPAPPGIEELPQAPEPIAQPRGFDLETLIGGRLPIWIGGIALVLAGFFLVRAAIDSGLIGPGVRVMLAALFAVLLVAASEAARRLNATRDDPRIAQVLSGAGVASAYGTLYLAAALYHLMSPLTAFVILLGITAAGLALAIRHGPPTAVMALAGGFLAPLVAGYDAAGIAPLMVYLALLVAALFALAIRRGWGWLAIATTAAGYGWTGFLTFALDGGDRPLVGLFVVALALAASLALPKSGARHVPVRAATMALGLAQLFLLAPILDFSPLAWSFYLILGGASVAFAWREPVLLPGALIALVLTLVLLALAPLAAMTGVAAVVASLAFGGAGLFRSRERREWALLAVGGIVGPLIVLQLGTPSLLSQPLWAVFDLIAGAAAAGLAWRHRDRIEGADPGLIGGALAASAAVTLAIAALAGERAVGIGLALSVVAIDLAARRTSSRALATTAAVPLFAALTAAHREWEALLDTLGTSLFGGELTYPTLPALADMLRMVAPPGLAAMWVLVRAGGFDRLRKPAMMVGGLMSFAACYVLAKQPLGIATDDAFVAWGFTERAAITLSTLAAGWVLAKRTAATRAALALAGIALFRILWLDGMVVSPLVDPQAVGGIPLLNAATIAPAIAALMLWTWPDRHARIPAMALTLVAALAAVRQIAHGSILTGAVGTGENWGYSAAMMLVALAWLWRGLSGGARDLRFAGLGLAMAVALKVFTIDIALDGILRVVSFLGIGVTLIAISWAYTRFLKRDAGAQPSP